MSFGLFTSLLATGCLAGPALAQAPQSVPSVIVIGRIVGTATAGATGTPNATRIARAKVGEGAEFGLTFDEATGGILAGGWDAGKSKAAMAWLVKVRPVAVEIDTAQLDIDWQRFENAGGVSHRIAGDRRTVTMRRGQRRVLDLVQSRGTGTLANVVVEIEVTGVTDPAYSDVSLAYDLWFVEEDAAGQKVARRLAVTGGQGERVPFSFAPIEYSLNRSGRGPKVNASIDVVLSGDLAGRLRPDGTLDVTVTASRVLRCVGGGAVSRESGTRDYNVRTGGTIALELPAPDGSCGLPDPVATSDSPKPGVSVLDGKTWVSFDKFFAGARTSLVLTVGRAR